MRILVSAGWLGGAGGAERALHSVVRALAEDRVDVVARQRLGGHLAEVGNHVRVFSPLSWRWRYSAMAGGVKGWLAQRVINPIRRQFLPRYDAYIQFFSGANLNSTIRARIRVLIPSGLNVPAEVASHYDYIAMQAPDNTALVPEGAQALLLPPPVYDVSERAEPPTTTLPAQFYLTVFNPYGAKKGVADLERVVDGAPYPIVWCHSEATMDHVVPEKLAVHPKIVHVEDATPEQLRYLYEHCLAYLSFSRIEGFGWGIADALRYSPAVVARRVGVLSFPQAVTSEVHLVGEEWSVDWSLLPTRRRKQSARALEWISPQEFRRRLGDLTDRAPRYASADVGN